MPSTRKRTSFPWLFLFLIQCCWFIACGGGGGGNSFRSEPQITTPGMVLSGTNLDFGSQRVQHTSTVNLTATNSGTAPLIISNVQITGPNATEFSCLSAVTQNIAPGQSATFQFSFTPTGEGPRNATVTIASNLSSSPNAVTVTGTGTRSKLSVAPGQVIFPSELPNTTSAPQVVAINSTGTADLVITSLAITGANASEFMAGAVSLPITVPAGQSTSIPVTFKPKGAGNRTATMMVAYDDMTAPVAVDLSGSSPSLEQDPRASVLLSPNSGAAESTINVSIAGDLTNFVPGATLANFGPGISAAGEAAGTFVPIAVVDAATGTVQVQVQPGAAAGPRTVTIKTGTHESATTFFVTATQARPEANAGPQQLVPLGSTVRLDAARSINVGESNAANSLTASGTDSGNPLLTFQWTLVSRPDGSAATISDSSAVDPTFQADQPGDYVAEVTVSDGQTSTTSAVTISTSDVSPTAVAGKTQHVIVGAKVQLDGSGSHDADGAPLRYKWELVSIPPSSAAALSDVKAVTPTFTVDVAGDYVVQLTVDDGHGNNASDRVTISTGTVAPVADAGQNQPATIGSTAQLDGSHSFDPDGGVLTYGWWFISKPPSSSASLNNPHDSQPTFVVDVAGTYVVQLAVGNADGKSSLATVTVSTEPLLPVANAGKAQKAVIGKPVHLDGSGSVSFNHAALAYQWSLLAVPAGSVATLTGSNTVTPSFVADQPGSYVAQLVVSDGIFISLPSTVLITGISSAITVSPDVLDFGNQLVGSSSQSRSIVITSIGTSNVVIDGFSVAGGNAADFSVNSPALPITLAPDAQTQLTVTFAPSLTGSRAATLSISSDSADGPHSVNLSGTGTIPAISVSPTTVSFTSTFVGATQKQTVTVKNDGTADLILNATSISGVNASDFTVNAGSTLPMSVAPGATAALQVNFIPSTFGNRAATLVINHNAPGSPKTIAVSGIGVGPGIQISTGSIGFDNQLINTTSAARGVTITNDGTSDLVLSSLAISGTNAGDFALSATATPITIAAGASAAVSVTFTPPAIGGRSATLTITNNVGSPQTVTLGGTGIAPAIEVAPATISYPNQLVTTSSDASTVTIKNKGTADLVITAISLTGGASGDFVLSTPALPLTITPGKSSPLSVAFKPTVAGSRQAAISITNNAGAAQAVTLSGTAIAPAIDVSPATLNFANQLLTTTSNASTFTIKNTGTADLVVSAISLGGSASADFTLSAPAVPLTIAPGNSSAISMTFKPTVTGVRTATVSLTHNAGGSPLVLAVNGTGIAPAITLDTTTLNFGSQLVSTGGQKTVTISNPGTADLVISNLAISGGNAAEFVLSAAARPITIAPGSSTTLNVTFTPTVTGNSSATLTVTDNAADSTQTVVLSGTGVAPGIDVSPATVAFGNQLISTASAANTITVKNTGTANLVVSAISLTGSADYTLVTPSLPFTVAPGNSSSISVTFKPTSTGSSTATVTITHNVNSSPSVVSLSGTGTAPAITLDTSALAFGNQLLNTVAHKSVKITNSGTADLIVSNLLISGSGASDYAINAAPRPITIAAGASTTIDVSFTPTALGDRQAAMVVTDNAAGSPHSVSLDGNGVAPAIEVTPTSVTFGNQLLNTTSAPGTVTIKNTGTADLLITVVSLAGSASADFTMTDSPLPLTLAPGVSSVVTLTFKPSALGNRPATLSIASNAAGSPFVVSVSGTGVAPAIDVTPLALTFGNQLVDTSSSSSPVSIKNTGTADLQIYAIALSGSASSDFTLSAPTLPITITAGGSVALGVVFKPATTGSRTSTITITHNAGPNPVAVPLSGTGTAPGISVSPAALVFTNQLINSGAQKTIALTNSGTADLVVSQATLTGTDAAAFVVNTTLPMTIAPSASANLNVTFNPATVGAKSATLNLVSNVAGGPTGVPLSGTGIAPAIQVSPVSVSFTSQLVNTTSAQMPLTITNTGTADLLVSALAISGPQASEFALVPAGLPITIAAGANATITLTFTPASGGPRSATLTISHNAAGGSQTVELDGTATAPTMVPSPTSVSFGNQAINKSSPSQSLTISNTGTGALTISKLELSGTNSGEFTFTTGSLPLTILPGANTAISVTFTPADTGARTANLVITSNASGGPQSVGLLGTGTAPVANVNPTAVNFGSLDVHSTSADSPITISNTGTADLVITSVNLSAANPGDFAFTAGALPVTVAPSGNTTITVRFSPTAGGNRSATLTIDDNAAGHPHTVGLTGNGLAPTIDLSPPSLSFASQLVNTTGVTQTMTLTNTGAANLVVSNLAVGGVNASEFTFSAVLPITLAPGASTPINVTFTPVGIGTRTATLQFTDNASGSPHSVPLTGNATALGTLLMPGLAIGQNLESLATVSVGVQTPTDVPVTISSTDPSRVLLSPDGTLAGGPSVGITIVAGQSFSFTGFYVQALDSSGVVMLNVSAPGYVSITTPVALAPSGFVVSSSAGLGLNFSTDPGTDSPLRISSYRLSTSLAPVLEQKIRGGISVSVMAAADKSLVGTILGSPLTINGGSSNGNVAFHPIGAGDTTVSVSTPTGFNTPTSGTSLVATVTGARINVNPVTVGSNLQVRVFGTLDTPAPSGGLTITVSSNNPNVLVSADPLVVGSSSTLIIVPAGTTNLPAFYVQSLASSGTAQITLTGPGYGAAVANVVMTPSAILLTGPSGGAGQDFATTTQSADSQLAFTVFRLDAAFNPVQSGSLRGGLSLNVSVLSDNPTAGVVTVNGSMQGNDSSFSNAFFHPMAGGSTVLTLLQPSGFSTPVAGSHLTVTVSELQSSVYFSTGVTEVTFRPFALARSFVPRDREGTSNSRKSWGSETQAS